MGSLIASRVYAMNPRDSAGEKDEPNSLGDNMG